MNGSKKLKNKKLSYHTYLRLIKGLEIKQIDKQNKIAVNW